MDSENDRKEEERKIFSHHFCLLLGFTDVDSENDRKEEERKILPCRLCLLAGFTHAAPESDKKKREGGKLELTLIWLQEVVLEAGR